MLSSKKRKEIESILADETISDGTRNALEKSLDDVDKQIEKVIKEGKRTPEEMAAEEEAARKYTEAEIDFLSSMEKKGFATDEQKTRLQELVGETAATETGLAPGEQKSEPIELSADIPVMGPEEKTVEQNPIEETKTDVVEEVKQEIDSEEYLKKLDDDIELLKKMPDTEKADKKFIGALERAYKAKDEGKISRESYNKFKNRAKDVLGGKYGIDVDSTTAKLAVSSALNKVKEKLIGQGYEKITLSSPIPVTPKTIADLIDLANYIAQKSIDGGATAAKAVQKAMELIKKTPTVYKAFG